MMLTEIAHGDDVEGPGLLLLDESLSRLSGTSAVDRWLSEIDDGVDPQRALPYAMITLAKRALAQPSSSTSALRSRIRTRSGRWLTLRANRLADEPARVSIIVEPIRPIEIAQLMADAYQLTTREREVVRLMAIGYSRTEMARLLVLSPHTVDDHIKRVFTKLQVRSRAELTCKLFFDQHAPRIYNDIPVGGTGWFIW